MGCCESSTVDPDAIVPSIDDTKGTPVGEFSETLHKRGPALKDRGARERRKRETARRKRIEEARKRLETETRGLVPSAKDNCGDGAFLSFSVNLDVGSRHKRIVRAKM